MGEKESHFIVWLEEERERKSGGSLSPSGPTMLHPSINVRMHALLHILN